MDKSIDPGIRQQIPDVKFVLDRLAQTIKAEINCVSIGTIKSFDADGQTATISINYKRIVKGVVDAGGGQSTDRVIDYPLLINCPVVVMTGGTGGITFPIAAGDTCIVLFCDRDIDAWYDTGVTSSVPNSERMHNLSDGIAIVGIRSKANPIASYEAGKVKVFNGAGFVTIDESGNITVEGAAVSVSGATVTIGGDSEVNISAPAVNINTAGA